MLSKERIGEFKKILKITLLIFVILTALAFWAEKAFYFLDDSDISKNCYKGTDIAIIEINGDLEPYLIKNTEYDKPEDATSSQDIIACLNEIKNNDTIKAVIVEINSSGGSPIASEEIMNTIKRLGKPTVAVIREGAVSGGYLIASATNRIFASEFSDIGGIGVTISYLDHSQKNQKEGIIYQQLSTGKFKDSGDPDKPLNAEERELFMRDVKVMHEFFVKNVAKNRKLDIEKVRKLADGSSMLGIAAKENGLIDQIGGTQEAKDWIENENGN